MSSLLIFLFHLVVVLGVKSFGTDEDIGEPKTGFILAEPGLTSLMRVSVDWARTHPYYKDCEEEDMYAVCELMLAGYCQKYRHQGDLLERFECPVPSTYKFKRDYTGTITFELLDQDSVLRIPTCRLGIWVERNIMSGCNAGERSTVQGGLKLLLDKR
jgi:hypothetical protein